MRKVENDLFGHDIVLYRVSGQIDELKFSGTKNVLIKNKRKTQHFDVNF